MGPKAVKAFRAYERTLVELARELAASDDPNKAYIGVRLLLCIDCNRGPCNQFCGDCELGEQTSEATHPVFEGPDAFEFS
jgi:hypothetical protein